MLIAAYKAMLVRKASKFSVLVTLARFFPRQSACVARRRVGFYVDSVFGWRGRCWSAQGQHRH
jgi:hypothetical protein